MKSKIVLEDLKKIKPDFENYLLNVALKPINAAFRAVNDTFDTVSKEEFLKVATSNYGVMYFIGKAYLAAREEEKSEVAIHGFYLFNELQNK